MKIDNRTKYRTDDLKAFLYWVARQEGHEGRYTKRLTVYAVPARRWHTGRAPLGGNSIKIRIPGPDILNKPKLASLIAHEMLHNHQRYSTFKKYSTERGMRSSSRYGYRNNERHWAESENLEMRLVEPKAKKVKGPYDRALEGQAKAAKKVADYEREIKRKQNLLKKWTKKLKYYDKRVEVTKDLPPPEPRQPKLKVERKKVSPVEYNEDGTITVALGEMSYEELICTEVDTFDEDSPEDYGDSYEVRKEFCKAMRSAEVLGKKQRRYKVRFSPDAARYFVSADAGCWYGSEHPAAARALEDRQYHVGCILAKKAANKEVANGD